MKNKLRPIAALFALLSVASLVCGCADEKTADETPTDSVAVDDIPVRDSTVIYNDDDDDSLAVMYLTVSQGNAADNTNHTWSEVNAYSRMYYEEKGIDRYRVEG